MPSHARYPLPAAAPQRCRPQAIRQAGSRASAGFPRLLIVEDDPGVAFALRLWMNELPLRYVLASSAGEARELLRDLQLLQTPCDALLADFCLSDEHGTAFVREFRRAQPRAAVAVMTGAEDPVLETWLARERLPLLRKPLDLSSLCNWLMTWL